MTASDSTLLNGFRLGPLAVADRSGFDESLHVGVAVAVDDNGAVVASVGEPTSQIYPRSALKPLQAAAMVDMGLDLPDRLLALAAASHSGERRHVEGALEILTMHGLDESALGNTPARPYGAAARSAARLAGTDPSSAQQNCSGKHAAMVATCAVNGWSIDDYLDPAHPLQVGIVESIERRGLVVRHVGVDGCGAPTHVVDLDTFARVIGALAAERASVARAMSNFPEMVGGEGRDVTAWMRAVPGLLAKEGAQGVMVVARSDGRAAALKIADGADAARQAATVEALRHLGIDIDGAFADVRDSVEVPVLGHGRLVGTLRAAPWSTVPPSTV